MITMIISCIELFRRFFGVPSPSFGIRCLLINVSFYLIWTVRKETNMSKVEKRRNDKLAEAVKKNDWKTVSNLLDKPFSNLVRKDRQNHLCSLNTVVKTEGQDTELLDLYSDNTYTPLEQLLANEQNEYLVNALLKLPGDDLHIFLEITLYGKSALQLTKETSFKSHKTIKNHYEATRKFLKEELEKYI